MNEKLLQITIGDDEEKKLDAMAKRLGIKTRSGTARFLINRDYEQMFGSTAVTVSTETLAIPSPTEEQG